MHYGICANGISKKDVPVTVTVKVHKAMLLLPSVAATVTIVWPTPTLLAVTMPAPWLNVTPGEEVE